MAGDKIKLEVHVDLKTDQLPSSILLDAADQAAKQEIMELLAQPKNTLLGMINARVDQLGSPEFAQQDWINKRREEAW